MLPKQDDIAELVRGFKEHPETMTQWKCPYCEESLPSHMKRIHHIKTKHYGMAIPLISENERLARKRIYNEASRAKRKTEAKVEAWNEKALPRWKTKAYRRKSYERQVARFHKRGLNAQGKPYKRKPKALRMSEAGKRNIAMAQQERREREKHLNGASSPLEQSDQMGEAARAIIVAAQVLRSVNIGLKL